MAFFTHHYSPCSSLSSQHANFHSLGSSSLLFYGLLISDAVHCVVHLCATVCNSMQLYAIVCNCVQLHATLCNCVQLCATLCNSMQLCATVCNLLCPFQSAPVSVVARSWQSAYVCVDWTKPAHGVSR
jgi:hypothetical protein